MGRTSNEVSRLRKARDHPSRRDLTIAGATFAGADRRPEVDLLCLYERYVTGGLEALEDRRPRPRRVWNRIADEVRDKVLQLALDQPELSPREVAITFSDRERTFVSEASVYRDRKSVV